MTNKELYKQDELIHGCGYYSVCLEHDCPCHPTAKVSQGFSEEVWRRMEHNRQEMIDLMYGSQDDDYSEEMYDGPLDPGEDEPFNPSPRSMELVDTYLKSLGLRIVPVEREDGITRNILKPNESEGN